MRKAVLFASLAIFACKPSEAPAPTKGPTAGQPPTTLVRRLESDAGTLNSILQTTDFERWVLQYVYDPLIDLDADLQPIPGTARSWEISPDGLVYTLHLDPNSTFSDGTPVLASDVLFTLKKVMSEESSQFAGFFEGLDLAHTTAVDPHTVRVTFTTPRVGRWYAFNIGVLPEHVYAKGDFKNAFNDTAIGNGPYRVARRERGRSIVLERRSDYRARKQPSIEKIVFKVIGDPATSWNALGRGEIDEMRVPPDLYNKSAAATKARFAFYDVYGLMYNCIAWNNTDPILRDVRVRKAISMAFDRTSVVDNLYYGKARAISGPFTPDQWAYNPAVKPDAYDLKGASALLDQAGWRDTNGDGIRDRGGRKLSIEVLIASNDTLARAQSQVLQNALKTIGAELTIGVRDGNALVGAIMKGQYQGAFMSWTVDPDPDVWSLFDSQALPPAGQNIVRYTSPEADKLIAQSRTEFDPAKRRETFHRLHALLAADAPYTWTLQSAQNWAVSRRVHGVKTSKGFGLFAWYPGPLDWSLK